MNKYDWLDVLLFVIAAAVILFFMIKRAKEIFYPSDLAKLEKDLETTSNIIECLERRYDKKYIDAIYCLTVIKDDLQSKIKKLKGGNNERQR